MQKIIEGIIGMFITIFAFTGFFYLLGFFVELIEKRPIILFFIGLIVIILLLNVCMNTNE